MPNVFIAMFFVCALFAYLTTLMILMIMIGNYFHSSVQLGNLRSQLALLCTGFESLNMVDMLDNKEAE